MPVTDKERARRIREFYGLDRSNPIMMPGYLPSQYAPQGASKFEESMRQRLNRLTNPANGARAGEFEAAALQEAGLTLKQRAKGGGYLIDKASALLESGANADARDLNHATKVRTFYGLDGSTPIMERGHLPSQLAPQGASGLEKSVRKRLYHLTRPASTARAGEAEADALREAGLTLKKRENGSGYKIDREATVRGSGTGFAAAPMTGQSVQAHTPAPAWSASAAYTQPVPSAPPPNWNRETTPAIDYPNGAELVEASRTFFPEQSGMGNWAASPYPQQLSYTNPTRTAPYTPSYYTPPANPTSYAAAHTYAPTNNAYRTDQGSSTHTSSQARPPQPQARPSRRAR
ncbi:hypothetical protein [Streptomyces sp. NPDC004250]|uniref:hypothetical protein n=1 Tax=Streptomyces sp. NPDC004250 TaxID=3364692 RepID=UPI0036770CE9